MRWLLGFRVGLLLVVLNLLSINMMAQQERGTVNLTYWGVTLTLPTGWSAQRGDNALGVSADDGSGVILIIPHALKTLAEIKTKVIIETSKIIKTIVLVCNGCFPGVYNK